MSRKKGKKKNIPSVLRRFPTGTDTKFLTANGDPKDSRIYHTVDILITELAIKIAAMYGSKNPSRLEVLYSSYVLGERFKEELVNYMSKTVESFYAGRRARYVRNSRASLNKRRRKALKLISEKIINECTGETRISPEPTIPSS